MKCYTFENVALILIDISSSVVFCQVLGWLQNKGEVTTLHERIFLHSAANAYNGRRFVIYYIIGYVMKCLQPNFMPTIQSVAINQVTALSLVHSIQPFQHAVKFTDVISINKTWAIVQDDTHRYMYKASCSRSSRVTSIGILPLCYQQHANAPPRSGSEPQRKTIAASPNSYQSAKF